MWPVDPNRITLRVCSDMDWRVTVGCPKCRMSTVIWPDRAPERRQAVPIEKLFREGVFRCRKPACERAVADRLTIDAVDVGMLRPVATWER